jgi:adenine-specific DNA-methyltransferase
VKSFEHKVLGQVFTETSEIEVMFSLVQNTDKSVRILEPSAGTGRIYDFLKNAGYHNITAVELDSKLCRKEFINKDFFAFHDESKYDLIIANPPYVKYGNIIDSTKSNLDMNFFNEKSNLYLHFIKKCIDLLSDSGELVFFNPIEFLKATSSEKLNEYIHNHGTITHFIDYGDKSVFKSASPNVCIWRFKKGDFSRTCIHNGIEKTFVINSGKINFQILNEDTIELGQIFQIKVGGVSGLDKLFINANGNKEFVCSETKVSGKLRKMFYNIKAPELEQYKEVLINRKIKKFSENDWWHWGRAFPENNLKRIYVNCKTRNKNPFFINDCKNYDGSILALFPINQTIDEQQVCDLLNSINWNSLGFVCGKRFLFSQRALEKCKVSKSDFSSFI